MSASGAEFDILWPALLAGLLVSATHVPLGMQVLSRGIVFIDLAVAQAAGVGVIAADYLGFAPAGAAVQVAALSAALLAALVMTWTERRWPQVQEAIIGVAFVLAASAAVLLLSGHTRGGEHLRELLAGQILWVGGTALAWTALAYALVLAVWISAAERVGRGGFYCLFAVAVTVSVQLVGLYLVFATLIIPALATRSVARARLPLALAIAALGYASGLWCAAWADLPPGALIPWTMALVAGAIGIPAAQRLSRSPVG